MRYWIRIVGVPTFGAFSPLGRDTAGASSRAKIPIPIKASMHVKHYTTTLLLNTSKPRMFIAYWMPCTSARPAGPRNPNRSPLSVRDSSLVSSLGPARARARSISSFFFSLSLSFSRHQRPLPPTHRPFVHRLDGNDLGAVSARLLRRPTVHDLACRCIDRSRGMRCKLFRSARSASICVKTFMFRLPRNKLNTYTFQEKRIISRMRIIIIFFVFF